MPNIFANIKIFKCKHCEFDIEEANKCFTVNHCTLPQASQEDLLHSFKSYSDVTIFHYTVPKDVFRATWHFAAFMDDPTCQPRKVYM